MRAWAGLHGLEGYGAGEVGADGSMHYCFPTWDKIMIIRMAKVKPVKLFSSSSVKQSSFSVGETNFDLSYAQNSMCFGVPRGDI